jgi:general secretion pathway protein A
MYTAFFGLREKPFALSPDPRFLFLSAAHREALAHLLYGIEQGEGFIAVTGEVGTGKTTLCRTLLRRLGHEVEVAFLFNPNLTARELLEAILIEFGVEKRGEGTREVVEELNHFLLERRQQGRRVLLIIDEAQGLPPETLEQIRLLSNLETESEKLIQILLLGQPELDELLESPELRQLRQRIGVRWRLAPLSREETGEYVRHRLRISADATRDHLFPDDALRAIYRRSRGIPRLVNLLCDRALLAAYADGAPTVEGRHVERAALETGVGCVPARPASRRMRQLGLPLAAAAFAAGFALTWSLGGLRGVLERFDAEAAPAAVSTAPPAAGSATLPGVPGSILGAPPRPAAAPVESSAPMAPAPALEPGPAVRATGGPEASPAAGTEGAGAGRGPAFVEDLGNSLALRAPGASAAESLDAVLAAWAVAGAAHPSQTLRFTDVFDLLAAHGLAVLSLTDTDLERLRRIGHPALLVLAADDGTDRLVALRRIDAEGAELAGVVPGGPGRVTREELDGVWYGEAYIVWREFEGLPEELRVGDAGQGVLWLQQALAELGFSTGPPSGLFDAATELAVRAFQADQEIEPDGTVGALTKISLYRALGRYRAPEVEVAAGPGGAG